MLMFCSTIIAFLGVQRYENISKNASFMRFYLDKPIVFTIFALDT